MSSFYFKCCFICPRKERPDDRFYRITDTVRFPRSDRNIMFCSPSCLTHYRLECMAVAKTHLDPRKKKLSTEEEILYYTEYLRIKEEEPDIVDKVTIECERRFYLRNLKDDALSLFSMEDTLLEEESPQKCRITWFDNNDDDDADWCLDIS